MLSWLEKIVINLGEFLKTYIYPFITPLFAILNYLKMREMLEKDGKPNWAKAFLIVSVIYFVFALGFSIYWLIKNLNPPPPS